MRPSRRLCYGYKSVKCKVNYWTVFLCIEILLFCLKFVVIGTVESVLYGTLTSTCYSFFAFNYYNIWKSSVRVGVAQRLYQSAGK